MNRPRDSPTASFRKIPDFLAAAVNFNWVCVEESMTEIFSDTGLRQLTQMFVAIVFFHTSEYILAIAIHGASRVTLSSLLITKHYALAMLISVLEYLIEIVLFPGMKQHWWISNFGLVMIVLGEIIRKTAIITAGRSFTHLIKIRREEHHRLVTEGVYRIVRHPSYSGFLVWSVGTQVMLCNPVSAIAFAVVVWRFFAERIPYEEHYLKQFFGRQYVEYAQRVPSGVPFTETLTTVLLVKPGEDSPRERACPIYNLKTGPCCAEEAHHLSDHHHHTTIGLGLGFCGAKIVQLSSNFLRPSQAMANGHFCHKLHRRMVSSTGFHRRNSGEVPVLHNCFSQREDDPELPAEGSPPVAGGIVALGKFDALHIGHRELAIQASRIGTPYLLSFVGMAEVLGENYRFGYKASGDSSELVRLCEEYGIGAYIISSVMDKKEDSGKIDSGDSKDRGQVSSTRVRQALAAGDMRYVSELLGRAHRLILRVRTRDMVNHERRISVPRSSVLNLPPGNGIYKACLLLVGDEPSIPCSVVVDTLDIHVEIEEPLLCNSDWSQEFRLLSVEFG
ncbi:unnamed protein product [Thlaspi arvense]|uniref:Protein-S-isoprenylcysteine O-methyltransferase n=1 Tax=Thlaspi arvense TaxID=13288 RepID=A0AAU9SVB9_THLAR|nr:unnamed protein product [Thlaspi arvense]